MRAVLGSRVCGAYMLDNAYQKEDRESRIPIILINYNFNVLKISFLFLRIIEN
jgi:hypothetical protein